MRKSKRHPFVAWLFDLYVFTYFIGGAVAFCLALTGRPGTILISLSLLIVALASSMAYHIVLAARASILSPGERIAGRYQVGGNKSWLNPYSRTRWPLFISLLLSAILAGNAWDGIGRGKNFSIAEVTIEFIPLLILTLSMVLVGQGRPWAIIGVAAYTGYLAIGVTFLSNELPQFAIGFMSVIFGVISLLVLIVGMVYTRLKLPASSSGEEAVS